MKLEQYFIQAAKRALSGKISRSGCYSLHGAIGVRADGAVVHARNNTCKFPTPSAHAETRLCRKLGRDAPLVIVVRTNKQGRWMLSRPCQNCQRQLEYAGVRRILYTVGPGEWAQL